MPKHRYNPSSQKDELYLTLKESFRDKAGRVHTRTLLTVGFVSELQPPEIAEVARCLTYRSEHRNQTELFAEGGVKYSSEKVREYVERYWNDLLANNALDVMDASKVKADAACRELLRSRTIKHTDARNVGAEWVCLQAINQLKLREFLQGKDWSARRIDTAVAHLVTRTVYSPSELKTRSIMAENSAVCELVGGSQEWLPSLRSLYEATDALYGIKSDLEDHLCRQTDDLFNQSNRIMLFDLTNFYFDSRKQAITLHEVCANAGEDHYLRICSPSKALTEASMNRQWRQRFEEELEKVNAAIGKKGGVKRYERVIERVGRAKERYPSIARFYDIEYVRSEERPDERADAHLFFGLLSYWVVNTVRLQLKRHGENCYWNEIVRRMSTQKLVTTQALNSLGEKVEMRICSEPTEAAAAIYDKLGYRHYPFRKMKICTTQT